MLHADDDDRTAQQNILRDSMGNDGLDAQPKRIDPQRRRLDVENVAVLGNVSPPWKELLHRFVAQERVP